MSATHFYLCVNKNKKKFVLPDIYSVERKYDSQSNIFNSKTITFPKKLLLQTRRTTGIDFVDAETSNRAGVWQALVASFRTKNLSIKFDCKNICFCSAITRPKAVATCTPVLRFTINVDGGRRVDQHTSTIVR